VTDLLKALSYGVRKTSCQVNTFKQTRDQKRGSGVFYVVRPEIVARQQRARRWTDRVVVAWGLRGGRSTMEVVFCRIRPGELS
jgi:hypothetical protein